MVISWDFNQENGDKNWIRNTYVEFGYEMGNDVNIFWIYLNGSTTIW